MVQKQLSSAVELQKLAAMTALQTKMLLHYVHVREA